MAMCSAVTAIMNLYREMGSRFPIDASSVPFYLTHAALFALSLIRIHFYGSSARATYLPGSSKGAGS